MEPGKLILAIERASRELTAADASDFTRLAGLLARRSELLAELHRLAPGMAPGSLSEKDLARLRSALAQGVFLTAVLRMKRVELAVHLEASIRQKTVVSSFSQPPSGPSRRIVDFKG